MSMEMDPPPLGGRTPIFFHQKAFAMRRTVERIRKETPEKQKHGPYSSFEEEMERILPTTRFTLSPERGEENLMEGDSSLHLDTRPYHWKVRHKKRWIVDSDLFTGDRGLDGIPGGPIESSFSISQVRLRRKILANTTSYSASPWRFKSWLERGRPWDFWQVKDELHSSYIFFHPADCLTYFYRHEAGRKVTTGEEKSFVNYLYVNELKTINRWKFYGKEEAPIVEDEGERRRLIQQFLRGLATKRYIELTQPIEVRFFPFIIFEIGRYTYPINEIFDITRLIRFFNSRAISDVDFVRSVELHCQMLSSGEPPLSAEHLFQRLGIHYAL